MTATHDDQYQQECTSIDRTDIDSEYVRVPADIAYWAEQHATAVQVHATAKLTSERLYSQAYHAANTLLTDKGVKRPTTALIEAYVFNDVDFMHARQQEILATGHKAHVSGILKAIDAKRDMLISLGAGIRLELQRDPIIRD